MLCVTSCKCVGSSVILPSTYSDSFARETLATTPWCKKVSEKALWGLHKGACSPTPWMAAYLQITSPNTFFSVQFPLCHFHFLFHSSLCVWLASAEELQVYGLVTPSYQVLFVLQGWLRCLPRAMKSVVNMLKLSSCGYYSGFMSSTY